MGTKDITEKLLEDYNDVFADIVNTLLFDGKEVIKDSELTNSKDKSQFKADNDILHEQERDVSKFWSKGKIKIALCGLENQTNIDKNMPFRVISYDGASYKSQILNNESKYPVVTIVLYFGTKPWDAPLSLKECFNVPEELEPYVNDYKINLFQIAYLSDEKVKNFKSDFGIIADFFVQKRKNNKYIPSDQQIKYVDAFLKLMTVLTGDKDYTVVNSKEGVKSMCDVLQGAKAEGRAEGRAEGMAEGMAKGMLEGEIVGTIKTLYSYMKKTPEEIADIVNQPVEYIEDILEIL